MERLLLLMLFAGNFLPERTAYAQDRVLIQQASGTRIPMTGYVEDYTGREILFRLKPNDPVRRYARSDVVDVTTEYTPRHERGRKLFAAGKISEAKLEFDGAYNDEDRPWVRREILAAQVKCALWNGDYALAISRFFPIAASDPDTFHYNLVPLCWSDDDPPAKIRFEAREWTAPAASPLSKLIGASWLLTAPDATSEVEQILRKLSREPDIRIQRLAQMQSWRLKLRNNGQVDPDEITRWDHFVEELPVELRGGSYFVIGQAWKQRKEHERAARAFLWLPLVFDTDRWLCSKACFEAAESLSAIGDSIQSASLYSEVVFRYGDTPWGTKAEAAWKALRQTGTSK